MKSPPPELARRQMQGKSFNAHYMANPSARSAFRRQTGFKAGRTTGSQRPRAGLPQPPFTVAFRHCIGQPEKNDLSIMTLRL